MVKNNAEDQIQQTAIESNGRIESLYEQINMISRLVVTNADVQKILTHDYDGQAIAFSDRQSLMSIVNTIQANSDGINSFELYTNSQHRIMPLEDEKLSTRIDQKWINQADETKGRIVWIGQDPNNADYFLAIRRVTLMDRSYREGGYLLITINRNYFQFPTVDQQEDNIDQFSIVVDQHMQPMVSNYQGNIQEIVNSQSSTVQINDKEYMVTKQPSDVTGWTVLLLTPVSNLTKGITTIRTGIIASGLIGLVIFFICSFFLSTMITKPITKLTRTMQHASKGTLETNPEIASTNEIKELNSTYNQLVKETNHLIKMVYEKEIIRSRSELKALQAQINPHFLFNTLDALHWSLEEKNEEELSELVVAMSNLFRYTITKQSDDEWVDIKDEIQHIQDYMEIMQMRFGDRLQWRVSLPSEYETVRMPKLLIQPLVENAILHGAGNKIGQCTVCIIIEAAENRDYLKIIVQDDGPGMDEEKVASIMEALETGGVNSTSGKGIAISNVYKRLHLYYQDKIEEHFMIKSEVDKGTYIAFQIPINGGDQDV